MYIEQYVGELDPKVARVWDYEAEVPLDYLRSIEDTIGPIQVGHLNPAANTEWDLLFFNDSSVFTPAANAWKQNQQQTGVGKYTLYTPNTTKWIDFWLEEERRCIEGYSIGGVYIPGVYYFFLNYSRMIIDDPVTGEREDFPMFTTMDYLFFLELNKNMNNPDRKKLKHMIIAKARRKGFSYKVGVVCAWRYTFFEKSTSTIAAEFDSKAKNTFNYSMNTLNWLSLETEFYQPTVTQNKSSITSGMVTLRKGRRVILGKQSTIGTITLHDKPDAAAGLGGSLIIIEEAGMCKDLGTVLSITEPVLRAGAALKGIMIVFGTGNAMDDGAEEFQRQFYEPAVNNFAEYDNIYDLDQKGTCGWFCDETMWRLHCEFEIDGKTYHSIDENGNCFRWVAEIDLNRERKTQEKSDDYAAKLSQYCKTPSEAFIIKGSNFFPAEELHKVLIKINQHEQTYPPYVTGKLVESTGNIKFVPDNKLHHLSDWPLDRSAIKDKTKLTGCITQYFAPETINGVIPDDAYIIGHDPWGVDIKLEDMTKDNSLGAVYVMRTQRYPLELGMPQTIVATYIGRTATSDEFNYNLYKLAKYYNAKIMFENDRGHVEDFFRRIKALDLLCSPPRNIIRKHTPNSSVRNRRYGHSMSNPKFKAETLLYIRDWLIQEDQNGFRNYEHIRDRGLIKELISFSFDKGNFDRIMALAGCILWMEDKHEGFTQNQQDSDAYESRFGFLTNNGLFNNGEKNHRRALF